MSRTAARCSPRIPTKLSSCGSRPTSPGKLDCVVPPDQPAQGIVGRRRNGDRTYAARPGRARRRPFRVRGPGDRRRRHGDRRTTTGCASPAPTALTIRLVAATNFKNYRDVSRRSRRPCDAKPLDAARRRKTLTRSAPTHVADHQRAVPPRDARPRPHARRRPADRRAASPSSSSGNDPHLAALVVPVRPLPADRLSSRPGGQPANLQGIWNDSLQPAVGQQVDRATSTPR